MLHFNGLLQPSHQPYFPLQPPQPYTFSSLIFLYPAIPSFFICLLTVYCFCFFSVPEVIDGNTLTATVVDLNAWVEYEFRVLAKNSVGVGEPSPVSVRTRTEDAGTVKAV